MVVTVRIGQELRPLVGGLASVTVVADTIGGALRELTRQYSCLAPLFYEPKSPLAERLLVSHQGESVGDAQLNNVFCHDCELALALRPA